MVIRGASGWRLGESGQRANKSRAACYSQPAFDQYHHRMLLTMSPAPLHGSTGILQMVMSSKHVATMCNGGSWECETQLYDTACNSCKHYKKKSNSKLTSPLPCISCQNTPPLASNLTALIHRELERFGPYWKLQSEAASTGWNKHILAVKWEPIDDPATLGHGVFNLFDGAPPRGKITEAAGLPQSFVAQGVWMMQWAVVLMHRPWCMWPLSTSAREKRKADPVKWAQFELKTVESLVVTHSKMARQEVPVLVVSYAQLLWDSAGFAARLKRFAPCVGDISPNFTPVLGVDVFPENQLKTIGTIADYSKAFPPENVGLDPKTLQCVDKPQELYQGLNDGERNRALAGERYLLKLTEEDVWLDYE